MWNGSQTLGSQITRATSLGLAANFLVPLSPQGKYMAKNRNTMAKRQRETDKRDKAVRKREKREERQAESKLPAANALAPKRPVF